MDASELSSNPFLHNDLGAPLTRPGTYVYYCKIHGFSVMHGSFTVLDDDDSDGVWHDRRAE